jgi:L-seryl-tRNA(Ser) seleniumtransferase
VHPSNYRIVGFTSTPSLSELASLAHRSRLCLYEDAGSGALFDLSPYGLAGEPAISDSLAAGADLVSFSGDKLLGAAQAGIIVGRRELVQRLRKHPLYRALRADKLALAALQATLEAYGRGTAQAEVPALRMLALKYEELESRARAFLEKLEERLSQTELRCEIIEGQSAIGGGSAPTTHPRSPLLALTHATLSAETLEESLRRSSPPVIARIALDRVLLDLRTIAEDEEDELLRALVQI